MKKIEFHDSVIEEIKKENDNLVFKFRYFAVSEFYDSFGFKFGNQEFGYQGTITINSASLEHEKFQKWPEPCDIYTGYILAGFKRYDLVDLQMTIDEPCAFFIDVNGKEESYFVFGQSMKIDAYKA